MHSLPIFLDVTGRPVLLLGTGETADAKRRLIERAGGIPVDEPGGEARIAIVALDDPVESEAAATRLKARGLLLNVADRPELCDFILPAIVDRRPVLIAVGTAGRSAGLAKALRQRIEALLPADLGRLAEALYAARGAIRARWPDAAPRRRAVDAGLAEGGAFDPLRIGAAAGVQSWLLAAEGGDADRLVQIRLRSADPDDLTLGEARLLGQADRIFHHADIPAAILDRARADAQRIAGNPPPRPGPGLTIDLEFA